MTAGHETSSTATESLLIHARDLAYYFEKEGGRPGTATTIKRLCDEIDRLQQPGVPAQGRVDCGEPVAWRWRYKDTVWQGAALPWMLVSAFPAGNIDALEIEPLYAAPAQQMPSTPEGLADFVRRCRAYLDDAPGSGGHSDAAGSNAYELIEEAIEHCTPSLPSTSSGTEPSAPALSQHNEFNPLREYPASYSNPPASEDRSNG